MTTTSETVLQALHAVLSGLTGPRIERNMVIPPEVPAAGLIILRDGNPGTPDITLSPLEYHYEHRAVIEVYHQGPDRDADFDLTKDAIGAAVAADRTLGGTCEWAEAQAPAPEDLPWPGAAPVKAATIPVIIFYSTSDPLA